MGISRIGLKKSVKDMSTNAGVAPAKVVSTHNKMYHNIVMEQKLIQDKGDAEQLAAMELVRCVLRANNSRYLYKTEEAIHPVYTFYSPLLLGPIYVKSEYGCNSVKICDGAWMSFSDRSLPGLRIGKLVAQAKQIEIKRTSTRLSETKAAADAQRTQGKQNLLNLLANVRTRQGR